MQAGLKCFQDALAAHLQRRLSVLEQRGRQVAVHDGDALVLVHGRVELRREGRGDGGRLGAATADRAAQANGRRAVCNRRMARRGGGRPCVRASACRRGPCRKHGFERLLNRVAHPELDLLWRG